MGGVQGREGSIAEVHAVAGGQLILRVAPSQTSSNPSSSSSSGERLNYLIPYNGRCYLIEQSMDVLEKIFFRLTPRELALLCLTCRTMNLIVSQFLRHYCSSFSLRAKLKRFYEDHPNLLLPKELVLRDRLESNSRHELLLYSSMRQFIGDVRRVSLCAVDRFDGLDDDEEDGAGGEDRLVARDRDVALKRDVVVVKRANRLYFRHGFASVGQGEYLLSLRLRLSNAVWERRGEEERPKPAVVTVSRLGYHKTTILSSLQINPSQWSSIEADQMTPPGLEPGTIEFDKVSDWFFLRLPRFHVAEPESNLEFEFRDVENVNARQGLICDFVELRKIVRVRHV